MTQREKQASNRAPDIRTGENPYLERVMRLLGIGISIAVTIFALSGIYGIINGSKNNLANYHNSGLNTIETGLQNRLDRYYTDLTSLGSDQDVLNHLSETPNIVLASARAGEIIRLHIDEYERIQFIEVQNGQAFLTFDRININGVVSDVNTHAPGTAYIPAEQSSDAFERLLDGERENVLGNFYLEEEEGNNQVFIDAYVPIYAEENQAQPDMIINLRIDTTVLRNVVNLSIGDLIDVEAEGSSRRVVLLSGTTRVVADSDAFGTGYIEEINREEGNIAGNAYYEAILDQNHLLANTTTPIQTIASDTVYSVRRIEHEGFGNQGWRIVFTDDVFTYFSPTITTILAVALMATLIPIIIVSTIKSTLKPILDQVYEADTLVQTVARDSTVIVRSTGNQAELVESARRISTRINKLSGDLESLSKQRNLDMQVAGRISRETATLTDLDTMAMRSINLICNELGFYHAQIFLLDESKTNAVLRYSRGEAGQALIEQKHQLAVGSDTVIGTASANKRAVIINDTTLGQAIDSHSFNPLLGDTRAEMGLPLLIGDDVIGVLDIQSRLPQAFLEADISTYQLFADQLAVAIHNARLQEQSERRIEQIDTLNRQLTRDAWLELEKNLELENEYGTHIEQAKLSADITIRGQVLGSLEADLPEGQDFSEGDYQILRSVADRVSLAIENARLFQETQSSLSETSTLYQLSRQLNEANDLEDVLQAIIGSITDNASGGQVWLFDDILPGETPDWALITIDLPIVSRENHLSLVGKRIQLSGYPLMERLSADDIATVNDITIIENVRDDLRDMFLSVNATSLVFIPLNMRGSWKGFMSITYDRSRVFSESEIRIYNALIAQAGVAIDNRLLLQQTEDALARQEKLYAASRIINTSQSLSDLVFAAVATSSDMRLDFWLALLEGDADDEGWTNTSHIIAKSFSGDVQDANQRHRLFVPDHSPMRRREPEILVDPGEDIQDVPAPVKWMRDLDYKFVAIFPLFSNNNPIALFYIVNRDSYDLSQDDYEVYRALTGQMSTQIQNRSLLTQTEETLNEIRRLYVATRAISGAEDTSAIYDAVAGHLATPFIPQGTKSAENEEEVSVSITFLLAHPEADIHAPQLRYEYFWNNNPMLKSPFETGTIISQDDMPLGSLIAANDDSILVYRNIDEVPDDIPMLHEILDINDATVTAIAPLWSRLRWFGVMIVRTDQVNLLDEGYERFLQSIADQVAIAIENQSLLVQVQSTLQETSVLYQASRALTEVETPEEIVDVITTNLIEAHINQVFIAILNGPDWSNPTSTVDIVASWQSGVDIDLLGISLSLEHFPAWSQLATDTVLAINDIHDETYGLDILEQTSIESLDTQSLVIMPLRVPGHTIGAIWLGSSEVYNYTDRDIRVFQAFAEQTSLSLEAKRLLEQTEQRARQLQTSAVISQSVGQILDLDVLLPQVVDLIKDQFEYDHVQVFLMDEENDWALLRASTGEAGVKLLSINHKLQRGSASVIGRVTELGEPSLALDTADATVVHKPNKHLPLTRSEMALPMIVKGEIVGALDVQSNTPNAFTEEDVQVLTTLASQIAVAIDNARLYEEAEQSAEDMAFLFEMTTAAAAADSLDGALSYVVEEIRENLNSEAVALYLSQTYEDYYGNRKEMIEIAALASGEGIKSETVPSMEIGDAENIIGMVSGALQPQIINNIERELRYQALSPDSRSAVVIPIASGSTLVGIVVLENRRLNAYPNEILTLLQTLAGSLGAVIQNTLLVEQLQESVDQLREVDRLKSQFLASMSHELRTPLNSIIGFSRVMLKGIDGPLSEMQEQDLTTIYNSGNHLLRLINDILDQAKIEANELNLSFSYFDMKPLVESVKSIAIGLLKEKPELRLQVELADGLPRVYGDENRSRQILLNLVTNAIKFTLEGSVTIDVYAIEGDPAPMIKVDVIDTGMGIAEKDLPTVFEQFRQVDNSLTRTVGGTGLGLPISKSLTEMQGGELTVASEVSVGSTFSVTIPTYEGADTELERQIEEKRAYQKPVSNKTNNTTSSGLISRKDVEKAKQLAENFVADSNGEAKTDTQEVHQNQRIDTNVTQNIPLMTRKRDVILVEDDKTMVDQFRRILQREGFEVTTADFPAFAEAMIGQLRPSLVILDVNFANGAGWELLKNLKERDDTFDIPIIVTTIDEDSERIYQLGAHTFIQRPFLPDDVLEAVLEAEKESQRERIVIIDDQPDTIRLLTHLLKEHSDFKIYSAESGDEGISLIARRRPNLIILDLRMPGKDGFTVLDELRKNPETAKIPVLVVTGEMDLSNAEQEQLVDIHVLHKTDISQEEYDLFIDNVRSHLEAPNKKK